ncbi:hypothetical protein G4B88_015186 [Cannabis sativa]|nr:hypothetical protein G4B88_015186 [Cannabis sativa]
MAILQGLLLCYRQGYNRVEIESYRKHVILILSNKTPLLVEFGNLILHLPYVSSRIDVISITLCKRSADIIAHNLAKIAF